MTTLREAAQQALEFCEFLWREVVLNDWAEGQREATEAALRAALAEEALQNLTDVQQEMERNFCPRCGKRTNDIHTCTPPHEEHFCDTHCTWLDHAPGCVRAEPVQEPVAWLFTHVQSGESDFCFCADEHDHDREMWHRQPLYTAPPQRKPLSGLEVERLLEQVIGSLPAARRLVRAIEQAHGIGE